ncbi:MAG: DUF4954 family protein [Muribaculum sp.]|nr:DUF4954 family protein [Muribaculaceae bacterium]MCM1081377.1 DUF4954 family protein [Muribaculum sp.]
MQLENYRLLTQEEIFALKSRNCTAENWHGILVCDFLAERYQNVNFSGTIKLGSPRGMIANEAGAKKPCGIYNASIHNCEIGPHVRISSVSGSISNYKIGEGTFISSVGSIYCHRNATFGNGTEANVMDETGGRAIKFYDKMSAQVAYLNALYRHRKNFIEALERISDAYIESCRSDYGQIGKNTIIENCPSISDVNIGDNTIISNVSVLTNGTIGNRCRIANSVVAENFIVCSQACVTNGSMLQNAFIGQATTIANGFTATHSLIFANCNLQCGEACSIIAGPHTESHHKASLLIGGIFSFFNAGSGTNQSNHMYRLGPMHHGVMERGCKTGSNSYVLWPAHFGQFSIIVGAHYNHPDTSMFPYSIVLGKNGHTHVAPGAVVCTAGLIRDLMKWPRRDKRDSSMGNMDVINYDIINPLNVTKMYRGLQLLADCETNPKIVDQYNFSIKHESIISGRENYAFAIDFFVGKYLTMLINETELVADKPIGEQLFPGEIPNNEGWIDLLGLLVPRNYAREQIVLPIINGEIDSIDKLLERINELSNSYLKLVFDYIYQNFYKAYSIEPHKLTVRTALALLQRWAETVTVMESKRMADGLKEFDESMQIGFSPDDKKYREADFMAVRGTPQDNTQLQAIHNHYTTDLNNCYHAMNKLKSLDSTV